MDTKNSGMEVPKATTVRPTRSGGMQSRSARSIAPETRSSPPVTRSIRPPISAIVAMGSDVKVDSIRKNKGVRLVKGLSRETILLYGNGQVFSDKRGTGL